jgi:hypothetical protein
MKDEKRPIHVDGITRDRFKDYCKKNGLKMGFVLNKILISYLNQQDEK